MIQIRRGVFETNSSSTHSLSMRKGGGLDDSFLEVSPEDNKVHVPLGEYGWGYRVLSLQGDKLSYLCTMLLETESIGLTNIDQLLNSNGYRQINDVIGEYCHCDGICIDSEIRMCPDGRGGYYMDFDGYIDHQSCEYDSLGEFLKDWGIDVENFVFNSNFLMIIDNDNC